MKKINFGNDWLFSVMGLEKDEKSVDIPHDAMIGENRSKKAKGRHNIGWFESHDYVYRKFYKVSEEDRNKRHILEFDGVYHNAEVYVNGTKAAFRPYGYTCFDVDITDYLVFDQANEIRVIARNADQPNSRWYSGAGMYRPVWLLTGQEQYVLPDGVKVRTLEIDKEKGTAKVEIKVETLKPGETEITLLDADGNEFKHEKNDSGCFTVEIEDVKLWSVDRPYIYSCRAKAGKDEVAQEFGVRLIEWGAEKGFLMNGERFLIKGACIHSDNGLLGACSYYEAEERKVRILKETGYNAIRSAHNPCSKELLRACDHLGMAVMDEYTDMWYIHKNEFDYAGYMTDWWEKDLADMVRKDYSHPSVIMYSTGNEVAETSEKRGIELTGQMTQYLHSLDSGRPVTCGVNIFFNALFSMGFGVYSDDKAKKDAENADKKPAVGSEFYNKIATTLGDKVMKNGARLHLCDVKTRDAFANVDVAGYNYGIYRYSGDLKRYPERLILGSETFCSDAYRFMEIARDNPRLIGDFVWAGMDYIGEAGIGSWEYEDYAPKDGEKCGWLTAGSGRINILGIPNGEAFYTKVALEKENGPYIAVKPVYETGSHSDSAWKMTDALPSWSYRGCEGMKARVEVYARAERVDLLLNGQKVAGKALKKDCRAIFNIKYEDGELTAVAFDKNGKETGRNTLRTAGETTLLSVKPEKTEAAGNEIVYIPIRYTDEQGILKPMEKGNVEIEVTGGKLLGYGNACPYNRDGYRKTKTFTHYGEVMAVIRTGEGSSVTVTVNDGKLTGKAVISVGEI